MPIRNYLYLVDIGKGASYGYCWRGPETPRKMAMSGRDRALQADTGKAADRSIHLALLRTCDKPSASLHHNE